MEKFLGVLFCGGRGKRLGEITKYISKSFIPVYNKPVFKYGLELLENSNYIDDIVILTNDENNEKLKQTGYTTIIQDDEVVFDMFSGWEYIKKHIKTKQNGVLTPSDNVSNISIDKLINKYMKDNTHLVFSIYEVNNRDKLKEMGCYDMKSKIYYYKNQAPKSKYGVIAPYIIDNSIDCTRGDQLFNHVNSSICKHNGYWFDLGDYQSIIMANNFIADNHVSI